MDLIMEISEEQPVELPGRAIYKDSLDPKISHRKETGVVFDRRMAEHRCLWDESHIESPERFIRVIKRCEELNLIERCVYIKPRPGKLEEVLLNHTREQYDLLKATSGNRDADFLEKLSSSYMGVYFHPSTFELSLLSVGCAVDLVDNILSGRIQNGMAIIRPPGHHAMKSEFNGFCYFNNVAIAARYALASHNLQRILIVDWDVHHGQGIQRSFYDDPRVLYISIHRYQHGKTFPFLRESNFDHIGENAGKGFNLNIPLNETGNTDADYLAIFQQLIMPMGLEFNPDLVIVACGFDSALGCSEGENEITPACYSHLLSPLLSLAGGKVAVVLEGGYCLKSLSEGAAITLKTLIGDNCPRIVNPLDAPKESLLETILNCTSVMKPFWRNLNFNALYDASELSGHDQDLHKVEVKYVKRPPPPQKFLTRNSIPKPSKEYVKKTSDRLDQLQRDTDLSVALNRVCFIFDTNIHPILADFHLIDRMTRLEERLATRKEIEMDHTANEGVTNETSAVGSVLQVVDAVLSGESRSGICIMPQELYAHKDLLENSVTIAAKYAQEKFKLKRVLIVDWSFHCSEMQCKFEKDPGVLFISLHGGDQANLSEKSTNGGLNSVGKEHGKGFTVNVPWTSTTDQPISDVEYAMAFQRIVLPIAQEYDPELVLISTGFNATTKGFEVSPGLFGYLTHWLSALAQGRVIVCADGVSPNEFQCIAMCAKALLGDPLVRLDGATMGISSPSAVETIQNVLGVQRKYWKTLRGSEKKLPAEGVVEATEVI